MIPSLRAYTSDVDTNNKHIHKCNLKYSKSYEENKTEFCSSDQKALPSVTSKGLSEKITTKLRS